MQASKFVGDTEFTFPFAGQNVLYSMPDLLCTSETPDLRRFRVREEV